MILKTEEKEKRRDHIGQMNNQVAMVKMSKQVVGMKNLVKVNTTTNQALIVMV